MSGKRISRTDDVIGFRRIFILFCAMVLAPTLLMSLFAFVAIAEEERIGVAATYIVLLVVFYGTLSTGAVIVSRLVWREATLSRLKTDFVSHVSHELRTPLTSIRMFIETLRMGRATPEEQEECMALLSQETERLSEMIERVLGYARLKSGRWRFDLQEVKPESLVDAAIAAFRAQYGHDGGFLDVDFKKNVAEDLPLLLADHDATVEALVNLLSNAYKYTEAEKEIEIFAHRSKRNKRVLIGVRDNGPGLPRSEHKRIFERFYQAGSLLSDPQQGSGLGLAITKGIVEGQKGRILVKSAPGQGATFSLELRTD